MKGTVIFISLFVVVACCSCKKVIHVDLNDAAPQIVIQGEVTDMPGPYKVTITKTVNFSATNNFPTVSGAVVTITDNNAVNDILAETAPGEYLTHATWQGVPGNGYTINVTSAGNTYTATCVMPQPVPLDSITFQQNGRFSGSTTISVVPNFQDPPGIANYYQFAETINDTPLHKIYLMNDRLSNGKYIHQDLFDDSVHIKTGDVVVLDMYSIDTNVYHYLDEMRQVSNDAGSVTPANPTSNFSNGALGFFSAHTVASKSAVAK
ncbi:MAG: DUF4249 domain-containing protein [Ginsengibacter sp.]